MRVLLILAIAVAGVMLAGCQTRCMPGKTIQCCTFDVPTCDPCDKTLRKLPAHDIVVWGGPSNPGLAIKTVGEEFLRDFKYSDLPKGRAMPVSWDSLTRRDKNWEDWLSIGATAAILGHGLYTFAEGSNQEIEDIGDFYKTSAAGWALGTAALHRDFVGMVEYGVSAGLTGALSDAMKEGYAKWRPDASDNTSFPSGHTTGMFSSAAFLHTRYGSKVGVPAYCAAILGAASRVHAQRHFFDDVLAGASLAMMMNWLFVRPYKPAFCEECPTMAKSRKTWRYEFNLGGSWHDKNVIKVPSGSPNRLDFGEFNDLNEPAVYTSASLEWRGPRHHEVALLFLPYDIQDLGILSQNFTANGTTFLAGNETRTRYTSNEVRLRWRYRWCPGNCGWVLKAGAFASLVDYRAEISQAGIREVGSSVVVNPGVHGLAEYRFGPNDRWRMHFEQDFQWWPDEFAWETWAGIKYQINHSWDLGLGGRYTYREIDNDDLFNEFSNIAAFLSFGYTFR